MGRRTHAAAGDRGDPLPMRHPELLPVFCVGLAVALAHLRWVVLTQWTCRSCGCSHIECECKPAWVKLLL